MEYLKSKRLRFINSTPEILERILEGNEALANHLRIKVPDKWTEFGNDPFINTLKRLREEPSNAPWYNWLAVLTDEIMLIGNCGYKGPPKDGEVEIGYEVIPSYRGIGLATEIAAVLVDNAFSYSGVNRIIAHTLPEENASCKVLRKCGFRYVSEVMDTEDGLIWRWEVERESVSGEWSVFSS